MRPAIKAGNFADATLVVRTDYSDDDAWRTVMELLNAPQLDALVLEPANYFMDDPAWDSASVEEVLAAAPDICPAVFLADAETMRAPYPLIAANTVKREDCEDDDEYAYEMENGREFRVVPIGVYEVSVNLREANMDFPEFAAMAQRDPAGYYQGLAATEKGAAALAAFHIHNAPLKG